MAGSRQRKGGGRKRISEESEKESDTKIKEMKKCKEGREGGRKGERAGRREGTKRKK